jgi:hypothetical protein
MNWTKVAKARAIERYGYAVTAVGERPKDKNRRKRRLKELRWNRLVREVQRKVLLAREQHLSRPAPRSTTAPSNNRSGAGAVQSSTVLPGRKNSKPATPKAARLKKRREVEVFHLSGERRTFVATVTRPR